MPNKTKRRDQKRGHFRRQKVVETGEEVSRNLTKQSHENSATKKEGSSVGDGRMTSNQVTQLEGRGMQEEKAAGRGKGGWGLERLRLWSMRGRPVEGRALASPNHLKEKRRGTSRTSRENRE